MTRDLEERLRIGRKDRFKSEGERRIADFFDSYGIRYVYEQGVLVKDRDMQKIWYPDFYLPEFASYLEYYGMVGDENYDRCTEHKKTVYSSMGLDVISVYPWTFCNDWNVYIMDSLEEIQNYRIEILSQKQYQPYHPRATYQGNRSTRGGYSRSGARRYR